jgi:energy-coupling factor transporter transmembrane protein EcfT
MSAAFMPPELESEQRESVLGRTNPLVKLGIALAWLLGLGLTLDVRPPLILTFVAIFAGLQLGSIPQEALARRLAPFTLAVLGIALANLLFSTHNPDPLASELLRLGPLRITAEAVEAAAGVGARVASIVTVGAVFALTTDMTRLIDSLVQLGRVSPRFAYGALAAYQAVPRLADDLGTLRSARRLRGLREWHPRLLVGLLVRAIRHADQLAVAMDARGFGAGPRTTYRPIEWTQLDAIVGGVALAILVVALLIAG